MRMTHSPTELMYRILAERDEVNRLSEAFNGAGKRVFGRINFTAPRFTPAELGLMRAVSWLYVMWFEAGRVGIPFIRGYMRGSDPAGAARAHEHLALVHDLRTWLQHNLDSSSDRGRIMVDRCIQWFVKSCGTGGPTEEAEWELCLVSLLTEAHAVLHSMCKAIRRMERDEIRSSLRRQWEMLRTRSFDLHEFEAIIEEAAADMGLEALPLRSLRDKCYQRWNDSMEGLPADTNFRREARKLVEIAILKETQPRLPIDGTDVKNEFGIGAGKRVGELLRLAYAIWSAEPCSKEVLLERLRSHPAATQG